MIQNRTGEKKTIVMVVAMFVAAFVCLTGLSDAAEYPLRAEYPMVNPISTAELTQLFGSAIIVDVRNQAEYDVVRIVGAKNILVGKMTEGDLLKLRGKNDKTPLVFYCNGITCMKSYKASKAAMDMGFTGVRCYDDGIFNWAKANPNKTEFFGKVVDAAVLQADLLSDEKFNRALITPQEFLAKSKTGEYVVFDIRDPNERSETKFSLPKMKVMSFDTMVELINKNSKAIPMSNILIADNVGKQTKWLQYYLDRKGIKNYYFMKGGIRQWKKEGLGESGR